MHQFLFELQYTEIWYWIERKTNKHRTAGRIMAAGMPYMNIRFKLPFAKNLRNNQDLSFNTSRRRARAQPPNPTVFRLGWDIDEIPGLLSANNGTTKIQWQGHVQDEVYLGRCGQFFVGKVDSWRSWHKGYTRNRLDLMKRCQVAKSHNHPFQSLWKRLWNMQHAFYMPPNTKETVT